MPTCDRTRRHFTEAAREAAALARLRKREHRAQFPEEHQLALVVVRDADRPRTFSWQIRRYGRMDPVAQSASVFADPEDAGRSGRVVLDSMREMLAAEEA